MRDVQLFFVKGFGCKVVEGQAPIELASFSDAIRNQTAHPDVHIAICPRMYKPIRFLGNSELYTVADQQLQGRIVFGTWIYNLDNLTVRVMYARMGYTAAGLRGSWHPDTVGKIVRIARNAT